MIEEKTKNLLYHDPADTVPLSTVQYRIGC